MRIFSYSGLNTTSVLCLLIITPALQMTDICIVLGEESKVNIALRPRCFVILTGITVLTIQRIQNNPVYRREELGSHLLFQWKKEITLEQRHKRPQEE